MGIALIKKINEKTPFWIKKPFSKIIRKKLIENAVFLETYNLLEKQDALTEKEQRYFMLENLRETLIHAYEHTKYYHDLFVKIKFKPEHIKDFDEIKRIPVLTKKILKDHFEELSADDISDYYQVSTGGTSGEPTVVLMEKDAIYKEWGFVYHYWSKFGYDYKTSRLATFRGVDLGKKICEINPLYQEIRMNPFSMGNQNIAEYLVEIEKYGADYIYGYPSTVYNFCRLCYNNGIDLNGKFNAVFLISENLYAFQETLISETIQCPIAILYGHSEKAVFGEKYRTGYVLNKLYGFTEISAINTPIVTGFINRKMPLIRYEVDDQLIKKKDNTYSIIGHHSCDVLHGKDGEQISMAAINVHDDTFKNVEAYQFVQEKAGICILRLKSSNILSKKQLEKISVNVNHKLGNSVVCSVENVDELEYTARGKYRMIIQKCDCGGANNGCNRSILISTN